MIKVKDIALLLTCSLIFSGSYIATKLIINVIPPLSIAFLRTLIATLCFIPFITTNDFKSLNYKKIIGFFCLGFFGIFLYSMAVFYALSVTSSTNVALINAANPIFTLIAAAVFFNPIISKRTFIAFFLSFLGVVIVITKGDFDASIMQTSSGELVMVGAMLSWVIYGLIVTRLNHTFSPIFITFSANLVGSFLLLPGALNAGVLQTIAHLSFTQWLLILYIGVIGVAIGFSLYSYNIKNCGPSTTTFVVFSMLPVMTALLAYFVLERPIHQSQIIGGAMILAALGIGLIRRKKPVEPSQEPV